MEIYHTRQVSYLPPKMFCKWLGLKTISPLKEDRYANEKFRQKSFTKKSVK